MRYVLALGLSLLAETAQADFYDGNKLHEQCQRQDQSAIQGYVAGWIDKEDDDSASVMDAAKKLPTSEAMQDLKVYVDGGICFPKGMTLGQAKDVFCQFLQKNPATRNKSGTFLIWAAYVEAWRCQK